MHRPLGNGQVVTMMRTTVSTQPQIIIVVCCITLRRSAYGAWGNYSVHDNKGVKNTSPTFIGHINPLRYRGYYYDRETRLYYLQSSYYDFANCRFINADGLFADSFIGTNLFAYCVNNPVNTVDYTGNFAIAVTAALLAIGLAAIVTATGLHRRLHTNLYYEMLDIIIVSAYNSAGGDPVQQPENVRVALGTIKAFIVGLEKITPQF